MNKKEIKIAVGMSGGLDSTMVAFLLKQKGYEVIGLTMKIWKGKSSKVKGGGCYGPGELNNIRDAKRAAKIMGIKHYVIDVTEEYEREVLRYFKREYSKGKTPNPCVMCNSKIKFYALLEKTLKSGIDFDYFATGHYAKVSFDKKKNLFVLKKGIDKLKDQSYFLYRLKQSQLKKIMFPLGNMKKEELKDLAQKTGFSDYAEKKESQNFLDCNSDIALLPEGKPGKIIDYKGNVMGEHDGITHYTLGQRKNLKIGGLKEPYYVIKIDVKKNTIIVGPKKRAYSSITEVRDINWIVPLDKGKNNIIEAKIRYGSLLAKCILNNKGKNSAIVEFIKPQFAITPGQSIVFYKGNTVLGGGIIK